MKTCETCKWWMSRAEEKKKGEDFPGESVADIKPTDHKTGYCQYSPNVERRAFYGTCRHQEDKP